MVGNMVDAETDLEFVKKQGGKQRETPFRRGIVLRCVKKDIRLDNMPNFDVKMLAGNVESGTTCNSGAEEIAGNPSSHLQHGRTP
jgi:hypothetical protein